MYRDMANPPMTYETVLDTVFTGTKNYLAGLPYLCETIRDKLTIQPTQDNALHNYCVTTSELAGVHSNSDIGIESEDQSPSLHSSINSRFNLVNHDPVPMVEWRKSYLNWIYETSHYGYPLADPCDKFCKKPIEIGDVGYIDDLGHFHFLFNATRPAEEQRVYKLPKPFKHFNVERVLRADSNVGNFLNLKTGGMLDFKASGSIPLQTFTEEAKFEIEFIPRTIGGRRSSNSSSIGSAKPMSEELGVILILGDNFYTVELEDDPKLRKYVAKHSRSWYLHFKGQDDHNLILVTSVNLQATWGRAAFSSNLPKGAAIFAGQVHESPGGQNSLRGLWVESPFPTPSIIFEGDRNFPVQHALRLRKDDVVGREEFTQALFIEGYRIRKRGEMERLDSSGPTPRPDRTLDKLLDVGVKVKHFFTSPFSTKSKVVSGQPGV
ncbi:hypothetical protein DL96DRAFT_680535 [Flagelloscypha sp. PMI_526]|nr:hypothetical protein DL96DRAFT_680535 [Flagelloscypha sp. PMI_526]